MSLDKKVEIIYSTLFKWANPGLFFVYFRLFYITQFKNINLYKHWWCVWDSSPGRQVGRRRRFHWAMAAPHGPINEWPIIIFDQKRRWRQRQRVWLWILLDKFLAAKVNFFKLLCGLDMPPSSNTPQTLNSLSLYLCVCLSLSENFVPTFPCQGTFLFYLCSIFFINLLTFIHSLSLFCWPYFVVFKSVSLLHSSPTTHRSATRWTKHHLLFPVWSSNSSLKSKVSITLPDWESIKQTFDCREPCTCESWTAKSLSLAQTKVPLKFMRTNKS